MPEPAPVALSRPMAVDLLDREGTAVQIQADEQERHAVARLAGLPEVRSLEAHLVVRPESGGAVRVTGEVRAAVVQTCVVTLEPFEAAVNEAVDVRYVDDRALAAFRAARARRAADPTEPEDDEDEPDPIVGGRIDLGALAAESVILGLDPYPKKPGAVFVEPAPHDPEEASPFAALKALGRDEP